MTYQIIIYLIIIAAILLFYVSRKIHSKSYANKYTADNDQELCEEDLKLYKEKKEKEILKRQLLLKSYSKDSLNEAAINDTKIVSVIEPIGKWTKLVMNEHFMKLMNLKHERKGGFWQIFVSMQGMMQGKSRYKGR
ncbi:hypothetical protein [Candidatus Mesenet endosymbiont of Phosphuga atrata]|uniref:hypothetical protein n=1 Tax=Candidatus Mesenet endosymbiont of Phosphuga atrata TaxID=3066221 RepID=UPI0030D496CD